DPLGEPWPARYPRADGAHYVPLVTDGKSVPTDARHHAEAFVPGSMQGRVVLITGTGGGQGRTAALAFAAEGAIVVGCDVDATSHQQTRQLVEEAGGSMTGRAPVDLSDPEQAAAWVQEAASEHGRIDVLYNNASSSRFAP